MQAGVPLLHAVVQPEPPRNLHQGREPEAARNRDRWEQDPKGRQPHHYADPIFRQPGSIQMLPVCVGTLNAWLRCVANSIFTRKLFMRRKKKQGHRVVNTKKKHFTHVDYGSDYGIPSLVGLVLKIGRRSPRCILKFRLRLWLGLPQLSGPDCTKDPKAARRHRTPYLCWIWDL